MMNHKNRKSWRTVIIMLLVLAVLPLNALALTEDTLEPAPENAETTLTGFAAQYLPAAGKPWNRKDISADETVDPQFSATTTFTRPWLTDLELARTRRLMEQVAAGEATYTGRSIVNAACNSNTGVGVYPLNPADYDGETYYVLLPKDTPLADNQILALIAAFEELGIPFDPDSLGGRNCHRDSTNESRELSMEERQRLETIRMLVRRGTLKRENVPEGTADYGIPRPGAVSDDWFFLYPYRSMTDDELTLLALHTESRWEDDPLEIEQMAKDAVHGFYPKAREFIAWDASREALWGDPSDGKYLVLYTVSLDIRNWQDNDSYLYSFVDIQKELGNEPEISYVEMFVRYNADESVVQKRTDGECIAAAKQWAEANLRLPDGKMPETWTVERDDPASQLVYITGETPDWTVSVGIYRSSLLINDAQMMSKKWQVVYENTGNPEGAYMPSNARPANRDAVSADEETDPQMVIRHEDYHASEDGFYLPWLTDLELARTRKLMEQAAAGEVTYTGPSAVNASGIMDGRVGVYPLNPADFDGEEFYVLLPQYESLTDEQILSLIAAFDELGIPFDPDSLCGRNCGRNMWFRQTRVLTDKEERRLESAKTLVRHGNLTAEDIPEGTPDGYAEMEWYGDDACFHFYPYREMTDDEINRLALHYEEKWEDEPEKVEQFAMDTLHGLFRKPLQLELADEGILYSSQDREGVISYSLRVNDTEDRWKDWDYLVIEKKDPGSEPEIARVFIDYERYVPDEQYNPDANEEAWIESAKAWAAENLQFPDGQEPEEWTVSYTDTESPANYRTAAVTGKTEKWIYSITVNQINLEVWQFMAENRSWYPEE